MKPMSISKRRFYFIFFAVVFLVSIPVVVLYTSGYRLDDKFRLVKTGGIYITAPASGTQIYVNNKLQKTTNILQRYLLEKDLTPGTYFVFVYKEGYWPWTKELRVHEQLVSDAHAFLVPQEPNIEEIPRRTAENGVAATNPLYTEISALFVARPSATSSLFSITAGATSTVTRSDTMLRKATTTIYARWLGGENAIPFYFCDEFKRNCAAEVEVFTSATAIKTADFFPGRNDVMLIARKNGIYAVEADRRKVQNFALVYAGGAPDFRIANDGTTYIKDGDILYRLSFTTEK